MTLGQIYKRFPTENACLKYIEKMRWMGYPTCPYCSSKIITTVLKEKRYHCNDCNTSFSVTVGTVFHKTKIDFQKWLLAISIVFDIRDKISLRQMAYDIKVNKNTAQFMLVRIRNAIVDRDKLLKDIAESSKNSL